MKNQNNGHWRLASVRVLGLAEVPESHRAFVVQQAERYLRRAMESIASSFFGVPASRHEGTLL
ncbi:MAG: hypothetical protein RLO12_00200, partial [Fulvivirga sp.]